MKLDVVQVQQWLSDISATRAQDGLDDGFKEAEKLSAMTSKYLFQLIQTRISADRHPISSSDLRPEKPVSCIPAFKSKIKHFCFYRAYISSHDRIYY